jgi:hypothetical protein
LSSFIAANQALRVVTGRERLPVFHRRITGVCGLNVDPDATASAKAKS